MAGLEAYNRSNVEITGSVCEDCEHAFVVYTEGRLTAAGNTARNMRTALAKVIFRGNASIVTTTVTGVPSLGEICTKGKIYFRGNGPFEDLTNDPEVTLPAGMTFQSPFNDEIAQQCLMCRTRPRQTFLMDCAHRVYCRECAQRAREAGQPCPLCRSPIARVSTGYDACVDNLCMMCLDRPPSCMVIPCGHFGFCSRCLLEWYKDHKSCPTCRTDPSSFKEVLWDV
jgi:ssDNA-binding Zn-finger/Zn-ribbon topoisomerase 1